MHARTIWEIQNSKENVKKSKSEHNIGYMVSLCAITLTNFLCWTQFLVMNVLILFAYEVSIQVVMYITLCVLPFNIILNPVYFTYNAIDFFKYCKKARTLIDRFSQKTRL